MSTSKNQPHDGGALAAATPGFMATATPALVSGAIQAVLFNPVDRALYIRVQERRTHFLDRRNFERPFQGFGNAAAYRTIVGASYMFWQDSIRSGLHHSQISWVDPALHPTLNSIAVGLIAGSMNGLALNNLQAVKFRMWSEVPVPGEGRSSFFRTASRMYQNGGVAVFFQGCVITMFRDAVFGVLYESMRHSATMKSFVRSLLLYTEGEHQSPDHAAPQLHTPPSSKVELGYKATFVVNLLAALIATIGSSPWNYVRSVAYQTPPDSVFCGTKAVARSLWIQLKFVMEHGSTFEKFNYSSHEHSKAEARVRAPPHMRVLASWRFLNSRLNVGWGSLRVGLGMAVGQCVFGFVQQAMRVT